MHVLSCQTGGTWVEAEKKGPSGGKPERSDPATTEIQRLLSDLVRTNNLVLLTGLGTSLHVNCQFDDLIGRVPDEGRNMAPTMRDLWLKIHGSNPGAFEKAVSLVSLPEEQKKNFNIEALLSMCKAGADFLQGEDALTLETFVQAAEAVIAQSVDFLSGDEDLSVHSELLRKISRRSSRASRPKIFTTNYDRCFEQAAAAGRYVVIDGFSHTLPQVFDSNYFSYDIVARRPLGEAFDLIPNVFQLYKLHGSIDWEKQHPSNDIVRVTRSVNPLLIYPRSTKYELAFEQPYIEMMSAFQGALRQAETALFVTGFGFNDNHIAEPILSAIKSNLALRVVICDPSLAPSDGQASNVEQNNKYIKKISELIKRGDARLALIAGTFSEIVPQFPDIAALTDLEQHAERIRLLRELD